MTPAKPSSLPRLAPHDRLRFKGWHKPGLEAGDYRLTAVQSLSHADVQDGEVAHASLDFSVAGPHSHLPAEDIALVYPPDGGHGSYANVLPHVVLHRATLPWERESGLVDAPWMMVLLVSDDEASKVSTPPHALTWRQIVEAGSKPESLFHAPHQLGLDVDPHEEIRVIDVEYGFLRDLLPSAAELRYLAHVREVSGDSVAETSSAVLLGSRLPHKNSRNTAYVVSLEHRYNHDGFVTGGAGGEDRIRLIVLTSWSFHSEDAVRPFATTFGELNSGFQQDAALRLPSSAIAAGTPEQLQKIVAARVEAGFVPVSYRLRTGETSAAWYHGPLAATNQSKFDLPLPATSPDALLIQDRETGMIDASYAAAWTLGRSLALADTAFALKLYNYKRDHINHLRRLTQWIETHYLPLPQDPALAFRQAEEAVRAKVDAALRDLSTHGEQAKMEGLLLTRFRAGAIPFEWEKSFLGKKRWSYLDQSRNLMKMYPELAEKYPFLTEYLKLEPERQAAEDKYRRLADADESLLHDTFHLSEGELPQREILDWLNNELSLLRRVPFQYLIPHSGLLPDPVLLPEESLRFFSVDSLWIECLRDGALAVGRVHREEHRLDAIRHPHFQTYAESGFVSGFVLRSRLVRDFPEMAVDGYGPGIDPAGLDDATPLALVEKRLLGKDVMLCLFHDFYHEVETAALHPPAERLHFGVEADLVHKQMRDANGALKVTKETLVLKNRKLDVAALASQAHSSNGGAFALSMIEAPPRGIAVRQKGAAL